MTGQRYGFTEAYRGALEIAQRDSLSRQDAIITLWREVRYLRESLRDVIKERDNYLALGRKFEELYESAKKEGDE